MHNKLNEKCLLESFNGRIVDLSFAHIDAEVLLGCVDESGCEIFKVTLDAESKMQTSLVFHLSGPPPPSLSMNSMDSTDKRLILDATSRIIWCMYIPDGSENPQQQQNCGDASKIFVLTRRNRADIFNLSLIEKTHNCSCFDTKGHLIIEQKSTILSVSFSPDGSNVAISCLDGEVGFFKISIDPTSLAKGSPQESTNKKTDYETQPICLKKWYPHDNKPVTSLYFLDDHNVSSSNAQLWNFILTGADYNREIKLWYSLKWECMQTIRFSNQSPFVDDALRANQQAQMFLPPQIKTCIDLSSKYLVLSDLTRKCFYVLHIFEDIENDVAKCTAISEFILAYPAVNFAIIDSQEIKTQNQLDYLATMIRLYCIQKKQLQEMTIHLNGEQSVNAYNNSSVSLTPQLNTTTESNDVLLASASQNGSDSSLLLPNKSKMNASMEFQRDVEQNTVKLKSLDVEVNKLSRSDNSVTPFLNSPNNVSNKKENTNLNLFSSRTSSLTQVTSATNLTSLSSAPAQVNGAAQNQSRDSLNSSSSSSSHLESAEIEAFSIKSSNLFNKVTFLLLFFLLLRYLGLG